MSREAPKENNRSNKNTITRRSHDEEDCQDKACSDAKSSFNSWLKNRPQPSEPECPLNRESLGRNTWSFLHTLAAAYPSRPTSEEKENMKEFIRLFSILYPCSFCAREFREDIKDLPPKLDNRKALSLWFCLIHNKVNEKLKKPQFDCSKVDERWRTGWKDGSCF